MIEQMDDTLILTRPLEMFKRLRDMQEYFIFTYGGANCRGGTGQNSLVNHMCPRRKTTTGDTPKMGTIGEMDGGRG